MQRLDFGHGMRAFFNASHGEQIEQRHAHGDAVGDLFKDAGLRSVGNFRGDFNAAVHGAGMKNDRARLGEAEAFGVELVKKDVIVAGKRRFVEAFGLDAKHDDDVCVFESFIDAENAADGNAGRADLFKFTGNPHGRAAERELASKLCEQMDVGARDAAVLNVAENRDIEIVDGAQAVSDGEGVEKTL